MSRCENFNRKDKIEYRLLTEDKIEDALSLQRLTMQQECVAIGVGIPEEPGASEEMRLVFREVIKDGITMIAVDTETDKLAAVAFNKIQIKPRDDEKDDLDAVIENFKHESCLELIKFIADVESSVDIFEKYNAKAAMELFYLGTNPDYQGRGIGSEIVKQSIEFAQRLLNGKATKGPIAGRITNKEVLPEIVFGLFASNYSQRIVEKLGFEFIAEHRYENQISRGKRMSERIGNVHKMAKLAVLKL